VATRRWPSCPSRDAILPSSQVLIVVHEQIIVTSDRCLCKQRQVFGNGVDEKVTGRTVRRTRLCSCNWKQPFTVHTIHNMENVPASPGIIGIGGGGGWSVAPLLRRFQSQGHPIGGTGRTGARSWKPGTPLRSGNEMASSRRRRGFNWKRPVPWIGCGAAHTAEEADVAASEDLQKDPRFGS
jgi:hypothetical protein